MRSKIYHAVGTITFLIVVVNAFSLFGLLWEIYSWVSTAEDTFRWLKVGLDVYEKFGGFR